MSKLIKRTLAFALVVCMLVGTMVIPTFATEPDAETQTAASVVYDFTTLSQLQTAEEGAEVMWSYDDGTELYGFGYQALNITHNKPKENPETGVEEQETTNTFNWVNSWYNYGVRKAADQLWYKDLNWMVIGTKNTKSNCESDWDAVTIGGYKQRDEGDRNSWNGLCYIHKDENNALAAGGWMAIKIKTPGVGNFSVDLQHTVNQYGAGAGSVYILPGVADAATIEAAIAAGTGKMSNTVNYYMKSADVLAKSTEEGRVDELIDGSIYKLKEGVETKINHSLNGQHTELGTVNLTDVIEEYTVVFTADAAFGNIKHWRVLPEKLTFTSLGETGGEARTYTFGQGNGVISTADMKALTSTGTATSEDGGYDVVSKDVSNATITYKDVDYTGKTIKTNYSYLRYYNSTSSGKPNTTYFATLNAETGKYLMDKGGNDLANSVTNYNLKRLLESNYNALGYKILGTAEKNNRGHMNILSNRLAAYYIGAGATDEYLALEIQAPGNGEYDVDLSLYNEDTGKLHMSLNVYILPADDADVEFVGDYAVSKKALSGYNAYYEQDYTADKAKGAETVQLIDAEDNGNFTYNFIAGKKYVMYLQYRDLKADGSKATYTSSNMHSNGKYSNTTISLNGIICTPVEGPVAAVNGEEVGTLTAALAAANVGDVVSMLRNAVVNNVAIPEGVTLDLSGKTLTVGQFTTAMGGKLVDSSAGNGLLNVLSDKANFTGDNALDENILPIYDAENTGYRFYAYSYNAGPVKADPAVEGAVRFWYKLTFEDDAAYDLIATGTSGVTLGVNLAYNDTTTPCVFANNTEAEIIDNAAAWAAAYATFAKTANDPWLWVRVQGVDAVSNLSVAPVISVGTAYECVMEPIDYDA